MSKTKKKEKKREKGTAHKANRAVPEVMSFDCTIRSCHCISRLRPPGKELCDEIFQLVIIPSHREEFGMKPTSQTPNSASTGLILNAQALEGEISAALIFGR